MDNIVKAIGRRIRMLRMKRGVTQYQLAELIDVSNVYISNLESGKRTPSVDTLIHIANALDVSTDDILYDCLENHRSKVLHDEFSMILDACSREDRNMILEIMRIISRARSNHDD